MINPAFLRSAAIYLNPIALHRWTRFYRQILGPDDLAFDVGSHVGNRARAMRRAGAGVVAVEPQKPFTAFLKRTLPRDVTVLDVALGRTCTEQTLSISSAHPTVSTLSHDFVGAAKSAAGFEHVNWDRSQVVSVLTVDSLIERFGHPKYIKIDVEGGEADVLAGLSHPIELLSAEYLPAMPTLALALIDQLAAIGNDRFNIVSGETARFLWPDWRDAATAKLWMEQQGPAAVSGDLFAKRVSE